MHRFTVVFFLVVSMSALSGVFGNPVDNPTTGMTNPKLYRREAEELDMNFAASTFEPHDKFVKGEHNLFCMQNSGSKKGAVETTSYDWYQVSQGIYFQDTKQWYRLPELQRGFDDSDCYERAGGPETMNKAQLKPFTSVIAPGYNKDTKLFIKELEGIKVDNNAKHNGCVQVADNEYRLGAHLSLYISTAERKEKYFKGLDKVKVTVTVKECDVLTYKLE